MNYWIQPWRTKTVRALVDMEGTRFDHVAGKQLEKVKPGDWLCAFNFKWTAWRPLGAMIVASRAECDAASGDLDHAAFSTREAERLRGARRGSFFEDEQHPEQTRHVFARAGHATIMRFDLWTPQEEQMRLMRFADGRKPAVDKTGRIYPRTYSNVRGVSRATAIWIQRRLTFPSPLSSL